jgi:hypothetical protein
MSVNRVWPNLMLYKGRQSVCHLPQGSGALGVTPSACVCLPWSNDKLSPIADHSNDVDDSVKDLAHE